MYTTTMGGMYNFNCWMTMRNEFGCVLDMPKDEAMLNGERVPLKHSNKGHYLLELMPRLERRTIPEQAVWLSSCDLHSMCKVVGDTKDKEEILQVSKDIESELDGPGLRKKILRLHLNLSHPGKDKLKQHLRLAGVEKEEPLKMVDEVSENCTVCRHNRSLGMRPKTTIPIAKTFNRWWDWISPTLNKKCG